MTLAVEEDEELLRIGCEATLEASLESRPKSGAKFKIEILAEEEVHDFIWDIVNEKNFMEKYLKLYTLPKLKLLLQSAMKSNIERVSTTVPIGKNFFSRSMILDDYGKPYPTEPHVLTQLLNTHTQQLLRITRRGAKSWYMKNDMLYHSVFVPNCYSLYVCQSWDVSKEHLDIIEQWLERNPLLFSYSGGEPKYSLRRKWSDSNKYLSNGSKMSCRSATLARKLSGKSPNRLYEDEKALYSRTSVSEELGIMKRGQYDREKMVHVIASAPAGDGTLFEKMCNTPEIRQFWDFVEMPVCDKIQFDSQGKPEKFVNIITSRLNQQDLLEEWYNLGEDRFMEQFMLLTLSVENRAITEKDLEKFFNRNATPRLECHEYPCILSYDLGKSSAHRSVIMISAMINGVMEVIRIIRFAKGHPFRTRSGKYDAKIKGVIDTIPDFKDNYNIQWVVGDATGGGAVDELFLDLKEMMLQKGIPSRNMIGYKWAGHSERFLGKFPLWQHLVLPKIQQGRIKSYFDENFQWEFRTWQAVPSPTGSTTLLKAMKQTYSDDIITTMMQSAFVAFKGKGYAPVKSESHDGMYSQPRREDVNLTSRYPGRQVGVPGWRDKSF